MFFTAWQFALAGLICAAGPIVIHLLNRRRYRVVQWAAMDFLRQAMQRNRRLIQLRDILLLLLRTAAVLLLGLALARPFLAVSDEAFDGSQPLHAVLVVDNSMSMGYELLEGTLLDGAKDRARQFIGQLPDDSRVSIVPLCGSQFGHSPDPYTKDDALQALERIEVVDRSASIQRALNEARRACEAGPALARRVVILSDQKRSNWTDLRGDEPFRDLPSVQVVDVAPEQWENTWISDFRVQDGLADIETPSTLIVEVQHQGPSPRRDVQVTLQVDGVELASKTVTLEPGLGAREVAFEHVFDGYQPEPGTPALVPVTASLEPDRLPADDQRHLIVPVVAALPVVFVDQYGAEEEDAIQNRLGETRHLRRLLVPVTSRDQTARQLVRIRHVKLNQLSQQLLEDARLVVIAGISDPGPAVPLLRQYVEQGGQLVIAAGAGFDPAAWTASAWQQGAGILPAPLKSLPIGALPEEAGATLQPFFLSYESLGSHYYFRLADTDEQQLRDLYAEPFFFKAVEVDLDSEVLEQLVETEIQRLDEQFQLLAELQQREQQYGELEARGELNEAEQAALQQDQQRLLDLMPRWLLWADPAGSADLPELAEDPGQRRRQLAELAEQTRPRPLARFGSEQGPAYLVERDIGQGRVLLVSSGLLSSWNTLPKTNTFVLFDRVLRTMIRATLPERNFLATERITLPLPIDEPELSVTLHRPGRDDPEILDAGFIGKEQRGVNIVNPLHRGLYRVSAFRSTPLGQQPAPDAPLWEMPLVVNGLAEESELTPFTREMFDEQVHSDNVAWVAPHQEISLAGAQIRGQNSWWYLILLLLGLMLAELVILAWPAAKARYGRPANDQ